MYDSVNLPLSSTKVIKKSLSTIIGFLVMGIFCVAIGMFFKSVIKPADSSQYANYFIFGGLALFLIPSISMFIYQYFYYKLYYYKFEDSMAEIRKGVVARATGHVYYKKIQSVYVDQDFLDRVFGLYDVHYETAGERSGFYSHVDGLKNENKDKLVKFLSSHVLGMDDGDKNVQSVNQSAPKEKTTPEKQDQTQMNRENCPISSRIIILNTLGMTFSVLLMLFLIFVGIISDSNILMLTSVWSIVIPVLIIVFLGSYIYNTVWFNNFQFKFTSEKGEILTKVIGQNNSFLYYDRVQNVNIAQSITGRLFGLYNIMIETAGETSSNKLVIPGLLQEDASKLKDFLLSKSEQYSKNAL